MEIPLVESPKFEAPTISVTDLAQRISPPIEVVASQLGPSTYEMQNRMRKGSTNA
ncbi:hypothetical protein HDF14_002447 [Edaphobacter lichenicola]|uniref:Uncharacterized protein n=1 Tax=Tunturiibacter gelidiferens TaxID=3069689 RepID=A0A9X0QE97_9BACT|nr:hypothetical protein [Edaphobacter lichenicola]